MANHVRRQLREAVATALTGLATTGSNVHPYRANPLQLTELPALVIGTPSEEAASVTVHANGPIERRVSLIVRGYASGVADLDDALDQIAKEVESVLAAGVVIGARTIALEYTGCEVPDPEPGEKVVGLIELRYLALLFNTASAPDVLT